MLRNLLIITGLLSITFFAYAGKKKKKDAKDSAKTEAADTTKVDYKLVGAPMPPLRLVREDGKIINHRNTDNGANMFIMMYNPTCEHCQEEANIIIKNLSMFNKSRILFMASPNMQPYFSFFEAITKVSKHHKIDVGLDSSGFIDKTFIYQSLPQINIYDKDRKLARIFTGDVPIDSLKQYIE
jgi:hypothetical protein